MRKPVTSSISHPFRQLSQSRGQITHVLLTRSPLEYPPKGAFPHDLHVLSTPPAFVLSQDQTLQQKPVEKQNPATNIIAKETPDGGKPFGTGFYSTLLSSQRTNTHHEPGLPSVVVRLE